MVIRGDNPASPFFRPLSRKKALKVGADLVRQISCYFEFYFRVGGIHLNDVG